MRNLFLASILAALAAGPARADVLTLNDGSQREGKVVKEGEEEIVLEVAQGRLKAEVTFKRSEVKSVEKGPTAAEKLLAEVEKRKAALKDGDAAGWVAYARWLDRQSGFSSDARAAWEKVLKIDADNEAARTRLGYQKVGGQWLTEDEIMTAKGLVKSGDKWVKPEEKQAEDLKVASAEDTKKERDRAAQAELDKLTAWRQRMEALAAQRIAENSVPPLNTGGVILGPYGYGYYGVQGANGAYIPFVPAGGNGVTYYYFGGPGNWPVWQGHGHHHHQGWGGFSFGFQYSNDHLNLQFGSGF